MQKNYTPINFLSFPLLQNPRSFIIISIILKEKRGKKKRIDSDNIKSSTKSFSSYILDPEQRIKYKHSKEKAITAESSKQSSQ